MVASDRIILVHPRARGADFISSSIFSNIAGSSPCIRGKHRQCRASALCSRLIPVYTGQTLNIHDKYLSFWFIPMWIGADLRIFDNRQSLVHQKAHPRTYEANNHSFTTRIVRVRFIPAYTGRTLNPSRKSSGLMDKRFPFASTSYDKISMYHLFEIYFCG